MDSRIIYFGAQFIFGVLFVVLFHLNRLSYRGKAPVKLEAVFILFLITLVLDIIWVFIEGVPKLRNWNITLETVYLSTMAWTGYVWFLHTLDFFPAKSLKLKDYKYILGIPVIIEIICILLSIRTGWIFSVDEGGTYIRGPYHFYTVALNYIYMLLGSYVALKCRNEATLSLDKRRFTVAALFPLPVLLLSGAQILLPPGLPAMQGGVLVSLLLLYGGSTDAIITTDHLTALPNRIAFEAYMMERIQKYPANGSYHLYLLEGDIDNFKIINDSFGHIEGDRALVQTADALREYFSEYGVSFRTGGDEFMIVVESDCELDIQKIRREFNEHLSASAYRDDMTLSMSLGISEYDGSMTLREFIDSADRDLYAVKSLQS